MVTMNNTFRESPSRLFFFTNDEERMTQMRQILRHYGHFPKDPRDKIQLFAGLANVVSEISEDEVESLEYWLVNGGSLPHPQSKRRSSRNGPFAASSQAQKRSAHEWVDLDSDEEEVANKKRCLEPEVLDVDAWVPVRTVDCIVCLETLPRSDFLHSNATEKCNHENNVCYECMRKTVSVHIADGAPGKLQCPSCPSELSFDNVRVFATEEEFARFDDLIARSAMHQMEGLRMCLAPFCGNGMLYTAQEIAQNPQMVCRECSFRTCVTHQIPWHEGKTCEEYDLMRRYDESQIEQLEKDQATASLLAGSSAICPTCKNGVTKTAGCDHMTCRCGASWNYRIGMHGTAQITELVRGAPVEAGLVQAAQLLKAERERIVPMQLDPQGAQDQDRGMSVLRNLF